MARPPPVPGAVPVLADRGYDPAPPPEPVPVGRPRRRVAERWFGWLKGPRRVGTRYGRRCDRFDGFVALNNLS